MPRRQSEFKRPHLDGHKAFGARAKTDQDAFSRLQLGKPAAAQGLHVDEDVLRAFALRKKPKAARPVEPFNNRDMKGTRLDLANEGARQRSLRWMRRARAIHR